MDIEKKIIELKKLNSDHELTITKLGIRVDDYYKDITNNYNEYNDLLNIYNNIIKTVQQYILKHQY